MIHIVDRIIIKKKCLACISLSLTSTMLLILDDNHIGMSEHISKRFAEENIETTFLTNQN